MSEDVEHNRRGVLSPEQARVVVGMDSATTIGTVVIAFMPLLVAGSLLQLAVFAGGGLYLALAIVVGAALIAAGIWGTFAFRRHMTDKARRVPVLAMDGAVSWNGHKWVAYGRGPLGPIDLVTYAPLPAAPYRFYVYEGRIVGAESLLGPGSFSVQQVLGPPAFTFVPTNVSSMTPLPIGDRDVLVGALAQTLGFSADDLAANRRGMLSPTQGLGPVTVVEGTAQLKWRLVSKLEAAHVFIVVGDVEVRVPHKLGGVFVPGLSYRLYRRADGTLVSLEPC